MERRVDNPAGMVQETFGPLAEEMFGHFCEELSVAESIDMLHIHPDDWDRSDIAVFAVSYVALAYRDWLFLQTADREGLERAIYVEAERVLPKLLQPSKDNVAPSGVLASRVDQLSRDWLVVRGPDRADLPFSRAPQAISFVCRHLLKPHSQAKAENLALMPFLQIYIPERFSHQKRLTSSAVLTS
jgi:hypothetical protein